MDKLLLFTLTSLLLHFRQTGSSPQFTLTSSLLNTDGRALTIYVDEPFTALPTYGLLPILTSSPPNSDGRAPTICIDEPFTATQTDGLLPTNFVDELPPQYRWTSFCYSPDELFQTARPDDLSPLTHAAELNPTTRTDEPSPTIPKDELYSLPTIDDLSHKQDAWLKNQVSTRKSDDKGHRPNPMSSTYSKHSIWEPSQFKQNSIQNFSNTV